MRTSGSTSTLGAGGTLAAIDLRDPAGGAPATIDLRDPSGDLSAIGLVAPRNLTDAEQVVLEAIARGLTNEEIAAELDISSHTVKTHVSHVMEKLGAVNRTDAARMLLRARSA